MRAETAPRAISIWAARRALAACFFMRTSAVPAARRAVVWSPMTLVRVRVRV